MHLRVIRVRSHRHRCIDHRRRCVFGIGQIRAATGEHRRVIHRRHIDGLGHRAGGCTRAVRVRIGQAVGQRTRDLVVVAGWVFRVVQVGQRAQYRLVICNRIGPRQGQQARALVVTAADRAIARHRQHVTGQEVARDVDTAAGNLRIVGVGHRQVAVDRGRQGVLGIGQGACRRDHRRVLGWRHGNGAGQRGRQRSGGRGAVPCIAAVVQRDREVPTRIAGVHRRIVARAAVAQLRQQRLHRRRPCCAAAEIDHQISADTTAGTGRGERDVGITDGQATRKRAAHANLTRAGSNVQHRQRVAADIGPQVHRERTRHRACTAVEIGVAVGIAHHQRASHKLQRRALLGVSATQAVRRHRRGVVVELDRHHHRRALHRLPIAVVERNAQGAVDLRIV